jgi:hypothetical protein
MRRLGSRGCRLEAGEVRLPDYYEQKAEKRKVSPWEQCHQKSVASSHVRWRESTDCGLILII